MQPLSTSAYESSRLLERETLHTITSETTKCPYCRGGYHQAAAYVKHLQTMHLDIVLSLSAIAVTGALCRKTDPQIATVPKTQCRSKDHNKDKDNSK